MKTNNFSDFSWKTCEIVHNNACKYTDKCIICVPTYKSKLNDNEKSSFNQLCKIIKNSYEICLVCPDNIELNEYINIAHENNVYLSFLFPSNDYFKSTETYSYMCETSNFYKCFIKYEYMLIYQLDGWIFTNFLDYYIRLHVDYIGSPWRHGIFHFNEDTVGNGGISLRRIQKFIDICESLTNDDYNKEYVEKEDLFFCKTLKRQINLKFANIKNASNFSLQSDLTYFIEKYNNRHLPMCIHAWDKDIDSIRKYIKLDNVHYKKVINENVYGTTIIQYAKQLNLHIKQIVYKTNKCICEKVENDIKIVKEHKAENDIKIVKEHKTENEHIEEHIQNYTNKNVHYNWNGFLNTYYKPLIKDKVQKVEESEIKINSKNIEETHKSSKCINILIIHYNTPYLTECLIKSINKFVKQTCKIYIFDNSDKMPFTYKQDNIKVFDNTHGDIINFKNELKKYPDHIGNLSSQNGYASAKHCMSVDKCFDLIKDNFILLDSDVLLKNDISNLYNDEYIFVGEIGQQQLLNTKSKKRVIPFICFINVKKCLELNIRYFNGAYMLGLSKSGTPNNLYETGSWFFEQTCKYQHNIININNYIVHYASASFNPTSKNILEWLNDNKLLWKSRVIYTCVTGNYENVVDPTYVQNDFDYICFTDNPNNCSNVWTFKNIPNELSNLSKIKQQRMIKICPHKFLSEYDESIWVDGSVDILDNMNDFISEYCEEKHKSVFIRKHPLRNCIYKEGLVCIKDKRDTVENISKQLNRYRLENYPSNNGLVETNMIYRKHNNSYCIELMNIWANEVKNYSYRDQLSFNYALKKCGNTGFKYLDFDIINGKYFKWYRGHNRKINLTPDIVKIFNDKNKSKMVGSLKNEPITLQEKLRWLNIYDIPWSQQYNKPLKSICADKLLMKEYCKNVLDCDISIPTIKVYNNVNEIKWNELPNKFVIKANHDSGSTIICNNKNDINVRQKIINKLEKSINTDFTFVNGFESHYYWINRKIIVEELLTDNNQKNSLYDYKFWCFNGEPKLYTINDGNGHGDIMYYRMDDTEYNLYGIKRNQTYKKPKNFELMVEYSKKLASAFKFVRVDFYEVNDKVYIGELTFTPGAMVFHYKNYDDEKYIGEFLKIK